MLQILPFLYKDHQDEGRGGAWRNSCQDGDGSRRCYPAAQLQTFHQIYSAFVICLLVLVMVWSIPVVAEYGREPLLTCF